MIPTFSLFHPEFDLISTFNTLNHYIVLRLSPERYYGTLSEGKSKEKYQIGNTKTCKRDIMIESLNTDTLHI